MPIRTGAGGEAAVVAHRCDRCCGPIEVLDPTGLRVTWSGRRSTVEWVEDAVYLCHRCRIAEASPDERETLTAHYARLLRIRDRLGVPPEVTLHLFEGRGRPDLPKFRGFHLALFGIQVRHWDAGSPIPSFPVDPGDGRPPIEFAVPLIGFGHHGIPAALECRWSTEDPRSPATMVNLARWEDVSKLPDLHKLTDGLALVHTFPARSSGRKRDTSRTVPPEVFAARVPEVYLAHLEEYGQHPTNADLATAFCVSVSTIERWLSRYKEDGGVWPPVAHL